MTSFSSQSKLPFIVLHPLFLTTSVSSDPVQEWAGLISWHLTFCWEGPRDEIYSASKLYFSWSITNLSSHHTNLVELQFLTNWRQESRNVCLFIFRGWFFCKVMNLDVSNIREVMQLNIFDVDFDIGLKYVKTILWLSFWIEWNLILLLKIGNSNRDQKVYKV